jgi:hypothetical protein
MRNQVLVAGNSAVITRWRRGNAMGMFMLEDDIYIGSLLENLNLRFGPGNLDEMVDLQKKFSVFSMKHSFRDSVDLLGLAGLWNTGIKSRWDRLLESYKKVPSDKKGRTGDQRIVSALMENLAAKNPLPVHFTAHDSRKNPRVTVRSKDMAIFYMHETFLVVSLPMKPRPL